MLFALTPQKSKTIVPDTKQRPATGLRPKGCKQRGRPKFRGFMNAGFSTGDDKPTFLLALVNQRRICALKSTESDPRISRIPELVSPGLLRLLLRPLCYHPPWKTHPRPQLKIYLRTEEPHGSENVLRNEPDVFLCSLQCGFLSNEDTRPVSSNALISSAKLTPLPPLSSIQTKSLSPARLSLREGFSPRKSGRERASVLSTTTIKSTMTCP
jgi:hypothetical protein